GLPAQHVGLGRGEPERGRRLRVHAAGAGHGRRMAGLADRARAAGAARGASGGTRLGARALRHAHLLRRASGEPLGSRALARIHLPRMTQGIVRSMTGFGRAEGVVKDRKVTVEIRSLNSKQLDLLLKLPSMMKEREQE